MNSQRISYPLSFIFAPQGENEGQNYAFLPRSSAVGTLKE
jgi:hypothetical protein